MVFPLRTFLAIVAGFGVVFRGDSFFFTLFIENSSRMETVQYQETPGGARVASVEPDTLRFRNVPEANAATVPARRGQVGASRGPGASPPAPIAPQVGRSYSPAVTGSGENSRF